MSAGIIALFVGLGGGAWVYNKLQRQSGSGNGQNSLIGAAVVGVILFIVVFTIAKTAIK